jgi:LysM repeat protein
MNNPHPLIPQGSNLEQKNKGRARVKMAVFFVLAIHGIGLMALLVQGCHQETVANKDKDTNQSAPAFDPTATAMTDTNPPAGTAPNGAPAGNPATAAGAGSAPIAQPPVTSAIVPTAAGEYTIAKGDTLGSIAKKSGITTKALMDANPGIEPTKLRINQKIHLPAATVAAGSATGSSPAPAAVIAPTETASGQKVYEVKTGDNLTTIARQFGTSAKAIRVANNLKSDSLKVKQKLTIPARTAGAATAAPAAAETTMASTATAPTTTAVR